MADQKYAHIKLSPERAEAFRKLLVLTQALPTGRQTPRGGYWKETVYGILTALARVDLTADELDVIDDTIERIAYPGTDPRESQSIYAAYLVRAELQSGKGRDETYDLIASELSIDKSTVGKHYRKYFSQES